MKLKRRMALILCVVLLMAALPFTANAAEESLQWNHIVSLTPELEFGSGLAKCHGSADIDFGYVCNFTMELQKKVGNNWTYIDDWTESQTDWVDIRGTHSVVHGYYYKVVVTVDVFDESGNFVETASESTTQWY